METGQVSPYDLRMVTKAIADAVGDGPRGTKARLARALDVEPATVTKWVQGQAVPERHRWPAIEDALGLPEGALARSASEPPLLVLSDEQHEIFLGALRSEVTGIVGDLTWESVMALLGTAAWLFHLERASLRHGIADPGYGGLEDFLEEWERLGDVKELNDLARSRVERHLAAFGGPYPARTVTQLAARSGKTAAASEIAKAAKKAPRRPKPPAED